MKLKRLLPALLLSATAAAQTPSQSSTVTGKSESANGFSVFIADGRSTSSMSRSGNMTPAFKKAFRQLEVGRAYAFPGAFSIPADDSADFDQAALLDLPQRPAFRALVDLVQVMDLRVVLRLCCADGRKIEFVHVGAQDHARAAALVSALQPEEIHEFPAVLTGEKPAAPADAATPLAQYAGEWRGVLDGDPGFYITMRCAWKADGQGMWREIMFDDSSDAPPVHDVAVLTSHGGGSVVLARDPRQKSQDQPAAESSYDPTSRTFTTPLPSPEPGVVRINTATFTSADTIVWKTVSQDAGGTVLSTSSGRYNRLVKNSSGSRESAVPITEELLRLPELPPFRATVVKRLISDTEIKVDLKIRGQIPLTVGHSGKEGWDQALKAASRLEEGRTYEFPDALSEKYISPLVGILTKPATDAMRSLQPFIGTWHEGEGGEKNTTRYLWKDDGHGLWREDTFETDKNTPGSEAVLITYDAASQSYREAPRLAFNRSQSVTTAGVVATYELGVPASSPREQVARWDAETQTYTWQFVIDAPQPNTRVSGSRRFVSPDRIEWRHQMVAEDGKVLQERSGHYQRTVP